MQIRNSRRDLHNNRWRTSTDLSLFENFSNSTLLRCMRHFESNCKDVLEKNGIQGSANDTMLDVVFGENGLVEADSKKI